MGHGGKRFGAGRPKGSGQYQRPTKVIRIPDDMDSPIRAFIEHEGYRFPFYSSTVSAGFPSPADDYIEEKLNLNERLISHPSATFFVEASGDSMINAGIQSGDMLVVDRSITPRHNHIAIVSLEGNFTVKRLHFQQGRLTTLLPENEFYQPITISENSQVDVFGIVTFVIHACHV